MPTTMLKTLLAFITLLAATLAAGPASAQALSPAQLATVRTACIAATPCANARTQGNVVAVLAWLNGERTPQALAWRTDVQPREADEAANYQTFDSLTAGKRDSWALFLAYPRDFTRARVRGWVVDVWGAATAGSVSEAILQAGTVPLTNAQHAVGGTSRTTGTVTALDRAFAGTATEADAQWLINN